MSFSKNKGFYDVWHVNPCPYGKRHQDAKQKPYNPHTAKKVFCISTIVFIAIGVIRLVVLQKYGV